MRRFIMALVLLGSLIGLGSCAAVNEPPAVIYPSRDENPSNYPIDALSPVM
jgi:hypothetical protein